MVKLIAIWCRVGAFLVTLEHDKVALKAFKTALDEFLDNLAGQDMFGSEGQLDPRGDQRR